MQYNMQQKAIFERIHKNCYSISSPVSVSEYLYTMKGFYNSKQGIYLCTLFQISECSVNK